MYNLQPEKKTLANKPRGCVKVLAISGLVAVVVVVLFAAFIFVALNARTYAGTSSPNQLARNIVYKVSTDRDNGYCYDFDTTYEMPSGTAQKSVSTCDGARSAEVDRRIGSRGEFVYLSVQNDEFAARISCAIYIDGKLVFQTYSEGQYVIASCSGSIP